MGKAASRACLRRLYVVSQHLQVECGSRQDIRRLEDLVPKSAGTREGELRPSNRPPAATAGSERGSEAGGVPAGDDGVRSGSTGLADQPTHELINRTIATVNAAQEAGRVNVKRGWQQGG